MRRQNNKTKTIAFVVYPGLTLLELIGPITTLFGLTRNLVGPSRQYRTVTVGERVESMNTDTPMALIPDNAFEHVPNPYGIIIPGGGMSSLAVLGNARVLDYVRFAAHGAQIVGSVSTGAFILAAAGLLEGRQVTTHPQYGEHLSKFGANYVRRNWVEDGRYITAAGVSGAIDMALYLTARLKDETTAKDAQLVIEYDPHPPFGRLEQADGDGENRSATTLAAHRTVLERALANRPDLRAKLFG